MRTLYHYPLCAFSRLVRIYLKEKFLEHELVVEYPWNRKKVFSEYPLQSDIPTLLDKDGIVLEGWYAIIEHLEQIHKTKSFFGGTFREKAEARRITQLFNEFFFMDVTRQILFEKIMKKHTENRAPDSSCIRKGTASLKSYMEHISWLADHRNWLAGNEITIADMAAAAQISCVDYTGTIDWEQYPIAKDWYVRIKSRPSFREILDDRVPDMPPAKHYANLDF